MTSRRARPASARERNAFIPRIIRPLSRAEGPCSTSRGTRLTLRRQAGVHRCRAARAHVNLCAQIAVAALVHFNHVMTGRELNDKPLLRLRRSVPMFAVDHDVGPGTFAAGPVPSGPLSGGGGGGGGGTL